MGTISPQPKARATQNAYEYELRPSMCEFVGSATQLLVVISTHDIHQIPPGSVSPIYTRFSQILGRVKRPTGTSHRSSLRLFKCVHNRPLNALRNVPRSPKSPAQLDSSSPPIQHHEGPPPISRKKRRLARWGGNIDVEKRRARSRPSMSASQSRDSQYCVATRMVERPVGGKLGVHHVKERETTAALKRLAEALDYLASSNTEGGVTISNSSPMPFLENR
ncbi:hypothetical protein EDB83DRAFT_2637918 [Lactarius deliciosus]|nr:hypothetical protein EDB83DRAFT_2637918 [Lactarius deliciosus]